MINETSVKLLATLDKLRKTYVNVNGGIDIKDDNNIDDIRHIICESSKIGHWIPVNPLQPDCLGTLKCSVCDHRVWGLDPKVDKYCFDCLANNETIMTLTAPDDCVLMIDPNPPSLYEESSDCPQPRRATNLNDKQEAYNQFICSRCGIELQDWKRVEHDIQHDETTYHKYVFKYCPECGCKIVDIKRGAEHDR